jgi:predicted PurR-regulated permease PerM
MVQLIMPRKIEISHRTIVFTVFFLLSLWLIYQIKDILVILFISLILMTALNPLVDALQKLRLPRGLAILLVYLVLWLVVGMIIAGLVPLVVDQTRNLIRLLPDALSQIEIFNTNQQTITEQLLRQVGALPENIFRVTVGVFSNIISVLTTLFITFYLLLERRNLDKYLSALLGNEKPTKVNKVINEIERRLGGWVRGELVLMITVGVFTYIGLVILGVDSAIPLAILAGLLEIIPNIGPLISAVPAVLVALTIHPVTALATGSLYFLVQLAENNLLVPKIMQRAVGVNPLVSILGLMVGFRLAGPAGAILAIPLIIVIQAIGVEFFSLKNLEHLSD